MVDFNQVPTNNLVPAAYTEFDKSAALESAPPKPHRALIMGIVPASATGTKDTPITIASEATLATLNLQAGQLWSMVHAFLKANARTKLDVCAIEEPSGGAQAVGKVQITGTATEDGTLRVYLNGIRIEVGVSDTDDAATVHTAIKTAIDAKIADGTFAPLLPFSTAVSVTPDVEITCDYKGAIGNSNTVEVDTGPQDVTPAGLTVSVTDFAAGTGVPTHDTAIANLGDTQFDTIVIGETDAAEITKVEAEMTRRWAADIQADGVVFAGRLDTHSGHTTYADTSRNSEFVSLIGAIGQTPPWIWASQIGGLDALNPNTPRPRFGMRLPLVKAPTDSQIFDRDERQLLLEAGVSTFKLDAGGNVFVERLITMYTEDPGSGATDPVFRNVSTMRNLAYLRWGWNLRLLTKYMDKNIADDGTQIGPGSSVITPSVIRGEAIDWFREMELGGRVEGGDQFEAFKTNLVVERDDNDVNRVNVLSPPNLVNELVTLATRMGFVL